MKKYKIIFILISFILSSNSIFSQKKTIEKETLDSKLSLVRLLTDTQQYSEAMRQLNLVEEKYSEDIESSLKNEVNYRLMVARVLRLSNQHDDAMEQINLLPDLGDEPNLHLEVSFRKAALYLESPKYSMEEQIKIIYPIINNGIRVSEELNNIPSLASFYNLNASIHFDECASLKKDCNKHLEIAEESYRKAMNLFMSINDSLNYHNSLNGLFRLAIVEEYNNVDSIKNVVSKYADESIYFPNLTMSRSLLGQYYVRIKNDSLGYFRQTILEKSAMIDAINKNADNTIEKLKLLYEFDSLKADLDLNLNVLSQKELVILEKNKRIDQNRFYSVILFSLVLILIWLLYRQRVLTMGIRKSNFDLNKSNLNYQLLIKESNHRIKNNLQMILSIIEFDKEDTSRESQELLETISSKILTISSLHKILDFKVHNQKVDLQTYFMEIVQNFQKLTKRELNFNIDFIDSKIESERIVYFGLILNELLSNTLKHRKEKDEIFIQVLKSNKSHIFIYRDNSNFKDYVKSNGIFLVENLIVRCGGRDLNFEPQHGEYKFYFNE
ncbi:histidine kinase dimerization/phosphoacceptor domain -containing protein [Brumimicrobium mesophilum]|uniref:histidine kinase dimerization/phosphoacceptor domain -containing protein n=1 Tax=Brumimicrobium mesophilum TaxID=392717 RepID=UPI000D142712|nr:sensor histidine kinase [Brumimicrobium mesophilum]